jgi:AcrR family transcriptional regulator
MPTKPRSPKLKSPAPGSSARERKGSTRAPERVHSARRPDLEQLHGGPVTDIQRARMIAAMIDVVSERGRANATVAHVVARSGVSRRTFYEVFADFEDCFLAALDQAIERASGYVLDGYDPREKWQARIRAALVGTLEFLEDEPAMGRLCVIETLGAGVRVHERRARVVDAAIAAVDEGRAQSRVGTTLPGLTAEGIVGGVLSVLHERLLAGLPLLELAGSLMGMIVLPYLGPAAAKRESARPVPTPRTRPSAPGGDPLRGLEMRLTYRTVRVLLAIAAEQGMSNREIGAVAGIVDQGQISKLLNRLERLGLVENSGPGHVRGASNAWSLTKRGFEVERLVAAKTSAASGTVAGA